MKYDAIIDTEKMSIPQLTAESFKNKSEHYLNAHLVVLKNEQYYLQRRLRLCKYDEAIRHIVLEIEDLKKERRVYEEALELIKNQPHG